MTKRAVVTGTCAGVLIAGAAAAYILIAGGSHADLNPKAAARQWLATAHYSSVRTTIPLLRGFGATAARIKVTSVDGPIWNSSDGRAWDGNQAVPAQVYSRVTATVEETIRGKTLASPVTFLAIGDATKRYEDAEAPPSASVSGGFTVGESFVVFLLWDDTPFENRVEKTWFQVGDYQANWRLRDNQAIAPVISRSTPAAQLMSEIGS